MRLRRFLVLLITVLSGLFARMAGLFRRLADGLERPFNIDDGQETAETSPHVSAVPHPPSDWLAHVRRDPPADWLERVRQNAPHLLDPQTRPSRPPAPPPPARRQMSGKPAAHRPPAAAERRHAQPLKQIKFQATPPSSSPSPPPPAVTPPRAETALAPPAGSGSEPAEAADDGPPHPGEGKPTAQHNPFTDRKTAETTPDPWPQPEQTSRPIAGEQPFPNRHTAPALQPPEYSERSLTNTAVSPFLSQATAIEMNPSDLQEPGDEDALAERSEIGTDSALPPHKRPPPVEIPPLFGKNQTAPLPERQPFWRSLQQWFRALPRAWVLRLFSKSPLVERQGRHPDENVQPERPSFTVWPVPAARSPIPDTRQSNQANVHVHPGPRKDLWPPLQDNLSAKAAVSNSFTEKQLEVPHPRQGVRVADTTLYSVDQRKITAAFWPTLPETYLDELSLEEELAHEPDAHNQRLDFEQRGPEWNE